MALGLLIRKSVAVEGCLRIDGSAKALVSNRCIAMDHIERVLQSPG